MKNGAMYLLLAAVGMVALCAAIAAGYFQSKAPPPTSKRIAIGAPISERQMLERRRANVGVVAVGGMTSQ